MTDIIELHVRRVNWTSLIIMLIISDDIHQLNLRKPDFQIQQAQLVQQIKSLSSETEDHLAERLSNAETNVISASDKVDVENLMLLGHLELNSEYIFG